jgi:hypothetical protein
MARPMQGETQLDKANAEDGGVRRSGVYTAEGDER